MPVKKIPETTISRLFLYLRKVTELSKLSMKRVSSAELGESLNLGAAQVRKDLGYFGQFGVSGSGYVVTELKEKLSKILSKHKTFNVAIVGTGHLGSALLAYSGFEKQGLNLVAAFDTDVNKIGKQLQGVEIESVSDMKDIIKEKKILLGIIAVPAKGAQDVADILTNAGVKCILNFAPKHLNVPEEVKVRDVDLSRELEMLSYFLGNGKKVKL
ncbi:MAG: redox-sensing transcriptional repressor Rex [Kiritimatiellae bacterium]|jgi:redox-sensing transcriptional repressor|nr:redox-sensing transcriptional repressor Rex [Kiritimatiellia bacterium]